MEQHQNKSIERDRVGKFASVLGICLNLLLAGAKIVVGLLSGLVSLAADGFNNLSDCGSSIVSFVSFKIAAKPADKEHPFGHRRAEYVATMIIAFLVLFLAVELLKESIGRIFSGNTGEGSWLVYLVLACSLAVKGGMFFFYRMTAKKINSDSLKATATDSACDCLSTLAVLVGALVSQFTSFSLDGYVGVLVALFIGWQGVSILLETSSKLIGQAPDPSIIAGIKARVLSHKGVLGLHDLHVYSYGPDKFFASVHIEVDANVPVLEAHELIDLIERDFVEQTDIILTGHLDPIVIDDERTNALRTAVLEQIKKQNIEWNLHDFRVVWGENLTKVIFDVTVPFACEKTDGEVNELVSQMVRDFGSFDAVITVERE